MGSVGEADIEAAPICHPPQCRESRLRGSRMRKHRNQHVGTRQMNVALIH
jgi:hypothetical protein